MLYFQNVLSILLVINVKFMFSFLVSFIHSKAINYAWSHTVRQHHDRSCFQAPPMSACRYMEVMAWLLCWPPRGWQVSHQRNLKECVTCMPLPSANKATTLVLKPRGDINRSPKQGYQWPPKRTYVLKFFF